MTPNMPLTFYGMRIVITQDRPKMQLSEDCPVTPEFRVEMNKWMLDFFGVDNLVPDGQVLKQTDPNNMLRSVAYMNERTYIQLQKAMHAYNQGAMR